MTHQTTKFGGFANAGEQRAAFVKLIEENKIKYANFFNKTPFLQLSGERRALLTEVQTSARKAFRNQPQALDIIKQQNLGLLVQQQAIQTQAEQNKRLSEIVTKTQEKFSAGTLSNTENGEKDFLEKANDFFRNSSIDLGISTSALGIGALAFIGILLLTRSK